MTPHRIAVIPGDGIGPEVIPEALACLETVAAAQGVALETVTFDWGSEHYLAEGAMMPADGPEQLAAFDAILLGPVGDPRIPDTVTGWGLILSLRQIFDQYVNLRPARLLPGVHSPLGGVTPEDVDIVFVRENTEGEYAARRRARPRAATRPSSPSRRPCSPATGSSGSSATRSSTRPSTAAGTSRARRSPTRCGTGCRCGTPCSTRSRRTSRRSRRTAASSTPSWRASCAIPPRSTWWSASNLFGDILTDLGAAIAGQPGHRAEREPRPTRRNPSLFQAIHGSAPDIAGRGIANPVAEIWSAAMLLDFLGEADAGAALLSAVETTIADPATRTPDLGGTATTAETGAAVRAALG